MTIHDKIIPFLRTHANDWVGVYRRQRDEYIDNFQQCRARGIPIGRFTFSSLNCYATEHKSRFRVLWVRYSGNPRNRNTRKVTYRVGKTFSVHRNLFRGGPEWQEKLANRCEDEFARVRELNYLLNKISKDVELFNKLAAEAGNNNYEFRTIGIPIELIPDVRWKEIEG